jgi:glutathione S-transferase
MLGGVAERLKLFVVPASHPCAAVERALELKGLAYDRVDLLPLVHAVHQQLVFGRRSVPGLVLAGGERAVGSRVIMRVLDGLEPDPPLLPADAALRAKVEAAEAWGEEVLQPIGRRVLWAALQRDQSALESYSEGANLPIPLSLAMRSSPVVTRLERVLNRASERAVREDLAALPADLDRIDRLIEDGVLGGEAVNAADLQIGSTLRLLGTLDDVLPVLEGRAAGALALRVFPSYPGSVPAGTLPAEWLPARQ